MLLSILIPVYNQSHCVDWTLEALTRQTVATDTFEVVVIDDASTDDTIAAATVYADRLDLRVVRNARNLGRSATRNRAVEESRSEHLLFLDGDSCAAPTLVERHLGFRRERPHDVLLGKRVDVGWWTLRNIGRGESPAYQSFEEDPRDLFRIEDGALDILDRTPWLFAYTHNLSISRAVFDKVGGFDESFKKWGFEDNDFMYNIFRSFDRQSGHFHYDPKALCYHMPHLRNRSAEWDGSRDAISYLKDKYRHFDMELMVHPPEQRYHAHVLPYYERCLKYIQAAAGRVKATTVADVLPAAAGQRLWIGFDVSGVSRPNGSDHYFDHALPAVGDNHHLFGSFTPFADDSLTAVVNVDLWSMLGPVELSGALMEGLRVAPEIYLARSKRLGDLPGQRIGLLSDPHYVIDLIAGVSDATVLFQNDDLVIIRCTRRNATVSA
ncbi:glycosyltransferase family 2 protein [Actinoplanes sp. NPDC051475]|uniref:glycosyltransferase family 2 protein n=1 Tax=Actinoplanes sp. NPDC051475 TaxID=3157225 RepID=UPI00344E397E